MSKKKGGGIGLFALAILLFSSATYLFLMFISLAGGAFVGAGISVFTGLKNYFKAFGSTVGK